MAHEAPLGGWCPHFHGAQHIEIASNKNDTPLRVASTRQPELANLRKRAADRNVLPRLQVNRPFTSGQFGQRQDLPLTNAPLGGSREGREGIFLIRTKGFGIKNQKSNPSILPAFLVRQHLTSS